MALTKAQRARLDKLATYLEGLPKNYPHFGMSMYIDAIGEAAANYARHNGGVESCGTIACAVGHGPAAGIPVPPRFIERDRHGPAVSWDDYATLFVGHGGEGLAWSRDWHWCFDSDWRAADNHHWGAAARIRYLLDHGRVPESFDAFGGRENFKGHVAVYAPYRIDAAHKAREAGI